MAYGSSFSAGPTMSTSGEPLPLLAWRLPGTSISSLGSNGRPRSLVTIPLTLATMPQPLGTYLHTVFNDELATGKTYPQEGPMERQAWEGYYCAALVVVGVIVDDEQLPTAVAAGREDEATGRRLEIGDQGGNNAAKLLETLANGRSWEECVGGCYYIKPNYPGRSSHNCNAGFLIPPRQRGLKLGLTLGRSYLVYAPMLGYRGSVFNLVYQNNLASLAIWDRLGFSRVGLIPKAGRLKTGPNGEEEYVDAVVVWKSFVEEQKRA